MLVEEIRTDCQLADVAKVYKNGGTIIALVMTDAEKNNVLYLAILVESYRSEGRESSVAAEAACGQRVTTPRRHFREPDTERWSARRRRTKMDLTPARAGVGGARSRTRLLRWSKKFS